jgi:hypothetical protein
LLPGGHSWSLCDHFGSVWRGVHIVKLFIKKFSQAFCYLRSLRSRYSKHLVFKLCSCVRVRDHVSHPHKTTGKIIVIRMQTAKFFHLDNTPKGNALNRMVANIFHLRSMSHVWVIWTVPWPRWLGVGCSAWRNGFDSRRIHVGFVVD